MEVARCYSYRLIHRGLDMKMPIEDPARYVPKIASNAGLDQKTQNQVIKILQNAKSEFIRHFDRRDGAAYKEKLAQLLL